MDEDSTSDAFFCDLIAAVEQQLEAPATRYVAATLDRLIKDGFTADQAKEAIARCLAEQTDVMYRRRAPFDEKAYRASLEMISRAE